MTGMTKLNAESIEKLKALLPTLDPGFMVHTEFRDFYRFVFQFSREGTMKSIEQDIVCALLPLLMGNKSKHTMLFVRFLEQSTGNDRITFDQWSSFLEFTHTIGEVR